MCGRPRKYFTDEERIEAQKRQNRINNDKRLRRLGRGAVANPCKRKKIKSTGITTEIGTLDRTMLNTAYIEMSVGITYTDDIDKLYQFKSNCRSAFHEWLNGQDMWDKSKHISIFETAPINKSYKGIIKVFSIQCHVIRDIEKITSWKTTAENLTSLVYRLTEEIKKTCVETGLELKVCRPTNLNQTYQS